MASMQGGYGGFPENVVDMSSGTWQYQPIDPLEMARAGQQGPPAYLPPGSYEHFILTQNMQNMRLGLDASPAQAPLALSGLPTGPPMYTGAGHMQPRGLFGENRGAMMETRGNAPQGPRGYYGGHGGSYAGPSREGSGHGSSRRQAVEINVNKAITKKLASAVHYQRVSRLHPYYSPCKRVNG